jgi:hypothetical protein
VYSNYKIKPSRYFFTHCLQWFKILPWFFWNCQPSMCQIKSLEILLCIILTLNVATVLLDALWQLMPSVGIVICLMEALCAAWFITRTYLLWIFYTSYFDMTRHIVLVQNPVVSPTICCHNCVDFGQIFIFDVACLLASQCTHLLVIIGHSLYQLSAAYFLRALFP